ncbi:protein kinase family protein [Algoriphagus antarcticus]|uniref:Serine/threonine protein kinase n=1 Tax=Algoriphagus antarcticus TaxID=238540 RepID=A0A3E0DQB1_9BACT|nr:serine/threonine-protein kinase [Algoriphagus antarcticus]REG85317.1 serine/threonine protein kinase [Algoriphagus antarcticus]
MIRDFDSFDEYSLLGQGRADGEIEFLHHLSYQDEVYKTGGFANIHKVVSVNRKQRKDLLLKIYHQQEHSDHAYNAVEQLHVKLKRNQLKGRVTTFQKFPTLLGMPFLVFKSNDSLTGELFVGLLMYDLSLLGYKDYGDEEIRNDLVNGIEAVLYSYQLAKTFQLLHDFDFLHSDVKAASIFINPESKMLCLIDFDSGFHYKTQEKPSTKGSITGWFRKITWLNKAFDKLTGNDDYGHQKFLHNEVWSLNAAIFQFFSGQNSPFSFLTTLDDTQKEKYIKNISWPNFKPDSSLFNERAEQSISDIQETIKTYEEAGVEGIGLLFKNSFNEGYSNYEKVVKPKEWINLFEGVISELPTHPVIISLESNKKHIDYGGEKIIIRWVAQKVDYVSIGESISTIGQSEIEVSVPEEKDIEVKFHNFYISSTQSIFIRANRRFPKVEFFKSDVSVRKDESPVLLVWSVKDAYKININGVKGLDPSSGEFAVKPIIPTAFKLQCEGGFGEISEAEVFIDLIRPTIKEFSYEVNLDYGLDNIDLKWKTTNAVSIEITPAIGKVNQEGIEHIPIKDETSFTLIVKGLFFTQSKIVKAKPFPLPIVKQLMVEFPKIELNATINLTPLKVPDPLYKYAQIKFQNTVDSLPSEIKYFDGQINFNLRVPDLKCNYEEPSLELPTKLTYRNLLKKVSKFLKFQSNE